MAADPPVLTGLHPREDADSLLVLMMVDPHRPVPMATLPWNLKAALVDDLVVAVLVVAVLVVAHLEVAHLEVALPEVNEVVVFTMLITLMLSHVF